MIHVSFDMHNPLTYHTSGLFGVTQLVTDTLNFDAKLALFFHQLVSRWTWLRSKHYHQTFEAELKCIYINQIAIHGGFFLPSAITGLCFNIFPRIRIPIVRIRHSWHRLIVIEIHILVRRCLETPSIPVTVKKLTLCTGFSHPIFVIHTKQGTIAQIYYNALTIVSHYNTLSQYQSLQREFSIQKQA